MLKILKKIKFDDKENRMSKVAATEDVVKNYKKGKNNNLDYLLSKRYGWMKSRGAGWKGWMEGQRYFDVM